jgi:DNA-binding MarR family transcriptional regulator
MNDTAADNTSPNEIWLSISELARAKGVDKSWISRRVANLEAHGKIETRDGPNRGKLVNVAQFDRAVGETTDLAKEQAAATARASRNEAAADDAPAAATFADAQRRKAHYEAELKALEFGERTGQLVAIGEVETVIAEIAEGIAQPINQLPLRADEIVAAAARDGAAGVRTILKDAAFNLLKAIAQVLRRLDLKGKSAAADGAEIEIVTPDEGNAP